MTVVAFLSQRGGVGKSTLSRALAREGAANGLTTKLADLDAEQGTVTDWARVRIQHGIEPIVEVECFGNVDLALKHAARYDLYVVDSAGRAAASTLAIAKRADLVVQPCGGSRDDLVPAVRVFHALVKGGVPASRLCYALNRISNEAEAEASRAYLTEAGYDVLAGFIPERLAYRQAQGEGMSLTEIRYTGLRDRADNLIQALTDRVLGHG